MWPHRRQPTRIPRPWDSPGKNTGVGCHFLLQCIKVKSESEVTQSCLTLLDPTDCSPPGCSIHGIFQARVLEWGAIAFSGIMHYCVPKAYLIYMWQMYNEPSHFTVFMLDIRSWIFTKSHKVDKERVGDLVLWDERAKKCYSWNLNLVFSGFLPPCDNYYGYHHCSEVLFL